MTTKHDQDKPRYDLLPPAAIEEMVKVLTFGAKKYAPDNWRTVPDAKSRYTAALLRHTFAMLRGERRDPETGLHHSAHIMCCASFIAELDSSPEVTPEVKWPECESRIDVIAVNGPTGEHYEDEEFSRLARESSITGGGR